MDGEHRRDREHEQPHDAGAGDREDRGRKVPAVERLSAARQRVVLLVGLGDDARGVLDRQDPDEEDYALSGGTQPLYRRYLPTSILTIARTRIVWLLVLAISAVLTVHEIGRASCRERAWCAS